MEPKIWFDGVKIVSDWVGLERMQYRCSECAEIASHPLSAVFYDLAKHNWFVYCRDCLDVPALKAHAQGKGTLLFNIIDISTLKDLNGKIKDLHVYLTASETLYFARLFLMRELATI